MIITYLAAYLAEGGRILSKLLPFKIICLENENGITQSTISKDDLRFCKVNVKCKRNRSINVCTKCELEICGSCSAKVLEIATCINSCS